MSPVSLTLSVTEPSRPAQYWFLLIGVNAYADPNLPTLQCCAADCASLGHILQAITTENFELLLHHDFTPELPSYKNIQASLEYLVERVEPQDTVLIYFAGHGVLQPQTGQPILCLADTRLDNLDQTGLSVARLTQALGECAARQQILWLDACHSGNPAGTLIDQLQQVIQRQGFYALLACDRDQQSWEFPALGHGVFTHFLLRGLGGEAATSQGLITMDGLYRYVYFETLRYIDAHNQQQRLLNQQIRQQGQSLLQAECSPQTPKRIVAGVGDIYLGRRPARQDTESPPLGLVLEGQPGEGLTIGRLLAQAGYQVVYQPDWEALEDRLIGPQQAAFWYLRGQTEPGIAGDSWLNLREGVRISRSSLRRLLRRTTVSQLILVLDCPGAEDLQEWLADLRPVEDKGQCLLAVAAPHRDPDAFGRTLGQIFQEQQGQTLTVAMLIWKLEKQGLHRWLSPGRGILEVWSQSKSVAAGLTVCPYLGLRAFDETSAIFFHGREELTQQLVALVEQNPFLAVIGASGSGKSSLVQAGLMTQVRRGNQIPGSETWWVGSLRPGAEPLCTLATRLGEVLEGPEALVRWVRTRPEPMVLLVVDQFEEIFTLASPEQRTAFLELFLGGLRYAPDRLRWVITLRADFVGLCLTIPDLAQALQGSNLLVPAGLDETGYRRAIEQPAALVGLTVEPELVEVLLGDLPRAAGDLPLLQLVLAELWGCRVAGALTLAAYRSQVGGLPGILERKADGIYTQLPPEERACVRWLCLNLVQLGEDQADTRRRVSLERLVSPGFAPELVQRTLAALTAGKLVVVATEDDLAGPATVEVVHEVLIRSWGQLREWLDEDRAGLRSLRQIEAAATTWRANDQNPDYLLQGTRLAEVEQTYLQNQDRINPAELAYMEACRQYRNRARQLEQKRFQQTRRLAAGLGILAVIALGFGGTAYWQSLESQKRAVEAIVASANLRLTNHQQLDALVESIYAQKLVDQIWTSSPALRDKTNAVLQQAVYTVQEINRLEGHTRAVNMVNISPDGQTLASVSSDLTIRLWRRDGTVLKILKGHTQDVTCIGFSPDSKRLASGSADQTIRVWNLEGTLLKTWRADSSTIWNIQFSPDGQELLSAGDDGTLKRWDQAGKQLKTLGGNGTSSVAQFSPDGQTIVSAYWNGVIRLWRRDGSLVRQFQGHQQGIWAIAFSPDGQRIASASQDQTIRLWNLKGQLLYTLRGSNAPVRTVSFSPDGQRLASAGYNPLIHLWNMQGESLGTLHGHTAQISSVRFSPDSQTLISGSDDRTVRLWSLKNPLVQSFPGQRLKVADLSFRPDGRAIATASVENKIDIWSLKGAREHSLPLDGEALAVAYSPDGQLLATGSNDKTIRLWRSTGQLLRVITAQKYPVTSLRFSPDGQVLASVGPDAWVWLWKRDGTLLQRFSSPGPPLLRVRFSPLGRLLATSDSQGTLSLWTFAGQRLKQLESPSSILDFAFSSDGQMLGSVHQDHKIRLWRIDGTLQTSITGHTGPVTSISFSPDGKVFASASVDQTIRLWDMQGNSLAILHPGLEPVQVLSFSPDAKYLVSGGLEGQLLIWRSRFSGTPWLLKQGCTQLQDYLRTNPQMQDKRLCS